MRKRLQLHRKIEKTLKKRLLKKLRMCLSDWSRNRRSLQPHRKAQHGKLVALIEKMLESQKKYRKVRMW